jgi:hypothetical protein
MRLIKLTRAKSNAAIYINADNPNIMGLISVPCKTGTYTDIIYTNDVYERVIEGIEDVVRSMAPIRTLGEGGIGVFLSKR